MRDFAPETLGEHQLTTLLPIWKNYTVLAAKVKKYPKGITLLLDWIRAGVEYKLKKEVLNGFKQKVAEIEQQRNESATAIETGNSAIQELETRISMYKNDLIHTAVFPL